MKKINTHLMAVSAIAASIFSGATFAAESIKEVIEANQAELQSTETAETTVQFESAKPWYLENATQYKDNQDQVTISNEVRIVPWYLQS